MAVMDDEAVNKIVFFLIFAKRDPHAGAPYNYLIIRLEEVNIIK